MEEEAGVGRLLLKRLEVEAAKILPACFLLL